MGWFSQSDWWTQSAVKEHLRASLAQQGVEIIDEASTEYGRCWWVAARFPQGERLVYLYLIDNVGGREYGYKPISEHMGPAYYTCPLRIIKAAGPTASDDASAWRDRVRQHHAAQKSKAKQAKREVKVGDAVSLWGREYIIATVEKGPRGYSGTARTPQGAVYGFKPKHVAAMTFKVEEPVTEEKSDDEDDDASLVGWVKRRYAEQSAEQPADPFTDAQRAAYAAAKAIGREDLAQKLWDACAAAR